MRQLIARIEELAQLYPDRECLACPEHSLSYSDFVSRLEATRAELEQLAISRLGIYANNSAEWAIIDLAASMAGLVVVPIPLFFSSGQIQHLVDNAALDGLYTDRRFPLAVGDGRPSEVLAGRYIAVTTTTLDQRPHYCKVTYTSGSTGHPKGACLKDETMMSIVTSLADALLPSQLGRHLSLLPFATLLENVAGIYLSLWMGRSVVIDDPANLGLASNHQFDPKLFASKVDASSAESVILLPQMLKLIIEADISEQLRSLKFIAVGGGKVAPELLRRAQELKLPVFEGYGLTECGSCVALNTPSANRIGSVGKPLPHAQVRIGTSGEVFVTGAAMEGYLQDDPAPSEISTGDAGFLDPEGFLHITGRIKNVIVSSYGRNISPEWVESHFLADARIQQMAVFGEAQPHLSAVFVAPDSLQDKELSALIEQVNATLPDYARVMSWTRSQAPFSLESETLTSNGKIRRDMVAKQFFAAASGSAVAA